MDDGVGHQGGWLLFRCRNGNGEWDKERELEALQTTCSQIKAVCVLIYVI